ncbi:hypothetical protein HYW21_02655 [Candidatus Woesearchaeota archaeon]|nr:hypothetical protein [Candidatus Woesearchaeota archaeon]
MSYANPQSRQEFDFIAGLMRGAHYERRVPDGIVGRMRELYGEPLIAEIPYDLSDRIRDASPELGAWHGGGWNSSEGQNGHVIGPGHYFRDVRRVVLAEFYPGKPGFDRVKQYWRKQRA